MLLFSRFPFLKGFLDPSSAEALEQKFRDACSQAGIEPDAPDAETIGIDLIADYASGWASSSSPGNGKSALPQSKSQ